MSLFIADRVKKAVFLWERCFMQITLTIPDNIAAQLGTNGIAARKILELAAVQGYGSGQFTSPQVQEMLGIDRFQLDGLLKAHGILFDYSPEELAEEVETIQRLQAARAA